jgi:short-subunit dehydrogenase
VLINNAGIAMRGRFDQTAPDVWRRVIDTNVLGCAYATRAALPYIRETRGSILFVSSLVAIWGFPMVAAYSASKMALDGMVESLRTEIAGSGVHLGIVYVGITQNDEDKRILSADGAEMSLAERSTAMPQGKVAAALYRAVGKRRRATVLTASGRALAALARFAPWVIRLGLRASAGRIEKLSK